MALDLCGKYSFYEDTRRLRKFEKSINELLINPFFIKIFLHFSIHNILE